MASQGGSRALMPEAVAIAAAPRVEALAEARAHPAHPAAPGGGGAAAPGEAADAARLQKRGPGRGLPGFLRRRPSAASLTHLGAAPGGPGSGKPRHDVYVMTRPFQKTWQSVLGKLRPETQARFWSALQSVGIGHYMIAFRPSGAPAGTSFSVFDFGPVGGDVTFAAGGERAGVKTHVKRLFLGRQRVKGAPEGVSGEVRENVERTIPKDAMMVGSTELSMEDIRGHCRDYGEAQSKYELQYNDCRHFVDQLGAAATGIDGISVKAIRQRNMEYGNAVSGAVSGLGLHLTNYENWPVVRKAARTTVVTAAFVTGKRLPLGVPAGLVGGMAPASTKALVEHGKRLVNRQILAVAATAQTATGLPGNVLRSGLAFGKDVSDAVAYAGSVAVNQATSVGRHAAAVTSLLASAALEGGSRAGQAALGRGLALAGGASRLAARPVQALVPRGTVTGLGRGTREAVLSVLGRRPRRQRATVA